MSQAELDALLADEIEKRSAVFDDPTADPREVRAALHTFRGSAAMAGHTDLSLVIAQLSARLRRGETGARHDAARLLRAAMGRLRGGRPVFDTEWPEPPPGLGPSSVDPAYRAEYQATVRERVAELEALLERPEDPSALTDAIRAVHSVKGAAAAIGDDLTTWYCHGLEAALKQPGFDRRRLSADLPRHISVLITLVDDPTSALDTLRPRERRTSAAPSRRASVPPEEDTGEQMVRVHGVSLERVLERVELIRLAQDEVSGAAAVAEHEVSRLRDQQAALAEALRLLGPPRPWGPPAKALATLDAVGRSLAAAADDLEYGSALGRKGADRLKGAAHDVRREIALVRRTSLSSMLNKIGAAVERLAAREDRPVRVLIRAGDAPLDREIAERLVDPLMQLARNALAHGLEAADERVALGKDPVGTLALSAERIGDSLSIVCEDDGRGVDIESVRRSAVLRGSISAEAARAAGDDDLLSLLFVPGLTTKREADLLAGRGVGLDLALNTVRRLGGTIRLERRPGSGLRATLEVPSERFTTDVIWLEAGAFRLALPVSFAGKVELTAPEEPVVPLLRCLGEPSEAACALSIELALRGIPAVRVGVDAVGEVEECNLRPLPTLLAESGPYSGAILRGDGSLLLSLDAALLAVRAWALS